MRICHKCGINETTSPYSSVCSNCACKKTTIYKKKILLKGSEINTGKDYIDYLKEAARRLPSLYRGELNRKLHNKQY